jgi:hypothetical protein
LPPARPPDVDLAYHIAEHHQHYATLVYLTTHDKFGNRDRLEQYMQGHIGRAADERSYRRHASRFAQELYSMYYKQGKSYLQITFTCLPDLAQAAIMS